MEATTQNKLTASQADAIQKLANGDCGVIGGGTQINGNTYRGLWSKGLLEGRGWKRDPYRLNEAGQRAAEQA